MVKFTFLCPLICSSLQFSPGSPPLYYHLHRLVPKTLINKDKVCRHSSGQYSLVLVVVSISLHLLYSQDRHFCKRSFILPVTFSLDDFLCWSSKGGNLNNRAPLPSCGTFCALFFAFSLFCFCAFLAGEVNGGIPTV